MLKEVKKFSYALFSNGMAFVASAVITLIAPRFMSVESYGYFQLYIFYLTYIGLTCLGWIDGIVLRYGGEYYDNLNKKCFSRQFQLFFLSQIIIGLGFSLLAYLFIQDVNKEIVCILFGIAIFLSIPCQFFRYLLQAVNRIEDYSKNLLLEKLVYASLVIIALILGIDNYAILICCDLIGKLLSLLVIVYKCRDIIFHTMEPLNNGIREAKENIIAGSKLLIANNAGYFINGIVRYAIEAHWDLIAFVKVSLTLNISNLLLTFVRVIGIVVFPVLKRMDNEKLPEMYTTIRSLLMPALFGILCFYYPFRTILGAWLPKYEDSLIYMALLFPICVYESKMSLLIETYMKALRKEKWMLYINCLTMFLSGFMTYLTVYVFDNLNYAVLTLVFLLAFRCIVSELLIQKPLGLKFKKDIVTEALLTIFFMLFNWFIGGWPGFILYLAAYSVYLIYNYKEMYSVYKNIKNWYRRADSPK
ncbi:hypothetical protein NSA48_13360 [Frisingicoccus caecimuris]|uniref:O-antigen/teichoic acid export membrane protein n=1 Tax=Frisingicoccus caecimuris TaxID=1796636 RepID=A0A4V2SD20_9FIRM|nr:hypothetical protein [Frisingicoccus caecimuris]MCR1919998.1 hypothetical protein [Frisingicoccus caecimuris]TCO81595.1 O-antigen/teichoic acid export membrane protein [Frisingicoccus caecimuris]